MAVNHRPALPHTHLDTHDSLGLSQASFYQTMLKNVNTTTTGDEKPPLGTVCVILGAGNQSFLSVSDVLYHMFVRGSVALLKHHPILTRCKPIIDYVMAPLIDAGYFVSLDADIPTTQALIYSQMTDAVHLTGGTNTHDAIVWGTKDPETCRANNEPVLKAQMFAELGAVTPYIVVPSESLTTEWTTDMIDMYASMCAFAVADNCSCNCLACKVLVLPGDAKFETFTTEFISKFKAKLEQTKLEPAYYPGIKDRYNKWLNTVDALGDNVCKTVCTEDRKDVGSLPGSEFVLPFVIAEVKDVSAIKDESLFRTEPFAPVVTIIRLPGATATEYVDTAFTFAQNRLWGNLSTSLMLPPSMYSTVIPKVIRGELLYGAVCINAPTFMGYQVSGYWGAPRGASTLQDAQSGHGEVCNAGGLFDTPRNSIAWVPWGKLLPSGPIPPFVSTLLARILALGWKAVLPRRVRRMLV